MQKKVVEEEGEEGEEEEEEEVVRSLVHGSQGNGHGVIQLGRVVGEAVV